MKERISATVDPETIKKVGKLMESGKYRNVSHLIEDLIKSAEEKKNAK